MELPFVESIPSELQEDVRRLLNISPLFAGLLRSMDESDASALFVPREKAVLPDAGVDWVPSCDSFDLVSCMRHLRQCKHRGMRHIIWWEMGVHGDIERSCTAIADFAAGLLGLALEMAKKLIEPRYGRLEGGSFCVIGLGKLGGRELNLGSDIDPLFVWQGDGCSNGGRNDLPAAEYFNHLSRMLIRLMSERSADGIVWPMDMRLRPGGDAAAICLSLGATVDFYQSYGQTWERAMLIKARPVAGDLRLGEEMIEQISPFIYRRYLDYTTVTALADMKRRIDAQAGIHGIGVGFDVKRGRGAIREIEFIIQSMQLLHGGANPKLRHSGSLPALAALTEFGALDKDEAGMLREAYLLWRRVEHAVQARGGEQTQRLPEAYADYLARALGVADIDAVMHRCSQNVSSSFTHHMLPLNNGAASPSSWLHGGHGEELAHLDDASRQRIELALANMNARLDRGMLPERSRGHVELILARAMPRWLDDVNGVTAVEALAELLGNISGRATWVDLLATHEGALEWLIGALSASAYVRDHVVRDPSWLEWPLAKERGEVDIRSVVQRMDTLVMRGEEEFLADVGLLVDRARLLCALAVDAHHADAAMIGAWMSDIADAATRAVLRLCLQHMHLPDDFPFVALAMGKHGSREMGLASDMDMVFVLVHDSPGEMFGKLSLWEHAHRIGRRMIQYLTGNPPFGAGFAFDARLRPSGKSGALVTNLIGFREYQHHHAQTWEHQALTRARPVAGPAAAQQAVACVVDEVLDLPCDRAELAREVMQMRDKMLDHLGSKSADVINLKQDEGGLVDIEFLAQFARLAFGGHHRGTASILRHLPDGTPAAWREAGEQLAETYARYRQMENALRVELWRSIGKLPTDETATEWETMRRHAAITSPADLRREMDVTRQAYERLLAGFVPTAA